MLKQWMVYKYVIRLVEALIAYNTARFLFAYLYIDLLLDKDTIYYGRFKYDVITTWGRVIGS